MGAKGKGKGPLEGKKGKAAAASGGEGKSKGKAAAAEPSWTSYESSGWNWQPAISPGKGAKGATKPAASPPSTSKGLAIGAGRKGPRRAAEPPPKRPLESYRDGEEVAGAITRMTDFGIFIDVGCAKEGLLPYSGWTEDFQDGDWVDDMVVSRVDVARNRLSLRFKASVPKGSGSRIPLSDMTPGTEVSGKIVTITSQGVYLDVGASCDAYLPWWNTSLAPEDVRLGEELEGLTVDAVASGRLSLKGPSEQEQDWWGGGGKGAAAGAWGEAAWWQEAGWGAEGWQEEEDEDWEVTGQEEEWPADDDWQGDGWGESAHHWHEDAAWSAQPTQERKEAEWKGQQSSSGGQSGSGSGHAAQQSNGATAGKVWAPAPKTAQRPPPPPPAEELLDLPPGLPVPKAVANARSSSKSGPGRRALLDAAFAALDRDKDGRLRQAELRCFAERTGFTGTDEEWAEEYVALCKDAGCPPAQGIDEASFRKMVDDNSDDGCYCTDEEIISMTKDLEAAVAKEKEKEEKAKKEKEQAAATKPAPKVEPAPAAKAAGNAAGTVLSLARHLGSKPPGAKWVPTTANSSSQQHTVAATAAASRVPEPPPPPPAPAAKPPQSREALVAAVFKALDRDGDGRLQADELQFFARKTGFEGNEEEWAHEYRLLCQESKPPCSPLHGLGEPTFTNIVNDSSDDGCYCTEEELRQMLQELGAVTAPQEAPAAGQLWTVGKGKSKAGESKGGKGEKAADAETTGKGPGDPWAQTLDPWSTNSAKKISDRTRQATEAAKDRAEKEAERSWGTFKENTGDPSKPAMDASKLLEASRAMIAARKAKEKEEEKAKEEEMLLLQQAAAEEFSRAAASSSSSSAAMPAKMVSMSATISNMGAGISRLSLGEILPPREVAGLVLCAPSTFHALAVASNAIRSILQNSVHAAQCLLKMDELYYRPSDGDVALLNALSSLARTLGSQGAPLLMRAMLAALAKVDDKQANIRAAAADATEQVAAACDAFAFEALLPYLRAALDPKRSPAMKLQAFTLLAKCQRSREGQLSVAHWLPDLLPPASLLQTDPHTEVRTAAAEAVWRLLHLTGNRDLEPHLQDVFSCYKGSKEVSSFIQELAEVVFVQKVEAPALAVVMPVLMRGLKSRSMKTQRQTCTIAANMCRLVSAVTDVRPFAPQLLPLLQRISEEASDPDVRSVATRAHCSLLEVADADVIGGVRFDLKTALALAVTSVDPTRIDAPSPCPEAVREVILDYAVMVGCGLGRSNILGRAEWQKRMLPLLEPLVGKECAAATVERLREIGRQLAAQQVAAGAESEPGEPEAGAEELPDSEGLLCDCKLTLACGAATLLNSARLVLQRGRCYGLVGGNDSGKSTLLRAIHERRVVGFPPADHLATALVEHGVGEHPPECNFTPVEYLLADPATQAAELTPAAIRAALRDMGFDQADRLKKAISTLSGGWRMKLNILRAMLQKPDLILLDEPTGHLDEGHKTWLIDYINGLKGDKLHSVSALVVSHDTEFLDKVCTDILHVADCKLRAHSGTLSSFLEKSPGVQLGSSATNSPEKPLTAFVLPEPGVLEGVKTKSRRFLFLSDVVYTYPSGGQPAVRRASVECSLRSRVAIVGPNGAGKSTLAALVVGELLPDAGLAWRHPNLRVSFVAQHAFHHLEQHMDLTATQYILKRFAGGEDHEAADLRAAAEEPAEATIAYLLDGERLVPCEPEDPKALKLDCLLGRRQRGRLGYEYRVQWQGEETTSWLPGQQLAAMGHGPLVKREDEKQATWRALSTKALTTPSVEAHFANFGLDSEDASHRRLSALSNGQRARVVLAAATWLCPHLLVLDEPTNYLDRPGLSALTNGLRNFGGGVLAISHSTNFLDEVCTERWIMDQGTLRREGADLGEVEDQDADAAGGPSRVCAVTAAVKAAKDKKRLKRMKELRRKNGEQVSDDEEEWWEDLQKKAGQR